MSLTNRRDRLDRYSIVPFAQLACVAIAVLVLMPRWGLAQQPRSYRSVNDAGRRIPDELERPVWRETQSHRGWEIREPQYSVLANTGLADARWAADHVRQSWDNAARLADRWTELHRQPDFGLGSTQIVIDSEPTRQRNAPQTTVNQVGVQTQIYLNVAPGQPALHQQVRRLREAAAFAMLHTAGLGSAAPPWVVQGLASYAAGQGLDTADAKAATEVKPAAQFGGQQWRYKRSSQDTLEHPAFDETQAASFVEFLLQGNDAEHAPAFLNCIREQWSAAEQAAARGGAFSNFPGDSQPTPKDTPFDRLIAEFRPQYEAWQNDPLIGQPEFEPEPDLVPELLLAEREMLVVLKIQRRLAGQPATGRPIARVTTFDREKGRQIVVSSREGDPPETMEALYHRLTDRTAPAWATLDVDGGLLLSSDTQRIEELLGRSDQRYSLAKSGDRWVLTRRFDRQQILQGWLEHNAASPARPLAKFQLALERR